MKTLTTTLQITTLGQFMLGTLATVLAETATQFKIRVNGSEFYTSKNNVRDLIGVSL